MDTQNQRMYILEMIDQGRISASEGLGLLEALTDPAAESLEGEVLIPNSQAAEDTSASHDTAAEKREIAADIHKWKRWWTIPLWIGLAITAFGALFMFKAQQSSGIGFWFIAASLLFALGVLVTVVAWQSRSAPWLHLRIQQSPGEKPERIAFSLPIPILQAAWLMKIMGRRFSGLPDQDWEQLLRTINTSASPENPICIQVDEGEDSEKVEIYIG